MSNYNHVLSPFKFGNVEVKNRLELAPMISSLATQDGYITREFIEYYKSFARGGVGIVTIGETAIDLEYARGHYAQTHLANDGVITGLNALAESIQKYGAKLSVEINHTGRLLNPRMIGGKSPIGPSPIISPREELLAKMENRPPVPVQEMNQDQIDKMVEGYASAALRCLKAGLEMVMVHGAHGQLISQFASPAANIRTDKYGGSLENRARFAIEVLTAIRKKVGNKLALEYRVSLDELMPNGMHEEETIEFLKIIQDKIDLVHVTVGGVADRKYMPHHSQPTYFPYAYNENRAEKAKKALKIPVACVGSVIDLAMADRIIAEGKADIVVMGRSLIADPEMVNKTMRGQASEVRPCLRCGSCGDRASAFLNIHCAVNPVTGREIEYNKIEPAEKRKNIVIVGGGPAGMEAALVASSRGHKVTLLEKENELGGALRSAAGPSFKPDMKRYLAWMITQLNKSKISIKLSTTATADMVKKLKPDVILLAAGAEQNIPDIPGIKGSNVATAYDVDMGKPVTGKSAVVAGAGLTGCETALHLAQHGFKVTVIDMIPESQIAADTILPNKLALMDLLSQQKVEFIMEVTLNEVGKNGVIVIDKKQEKHEIHADAVVLALGSKPRSFLAAEMHGIAPEMYVIGDCLNARNLMAAIHDGFNIAARV